MASWFARPSAGAVGSGSWRVEKPVVDNDKCILCGLCWLYCPDGVVEIGDSGVKIDYDYCKGCGVCARECPVNAIKMVRER